MTSNNLTPAQIERLAVLSEELGESIQEVGKILRHGYLTHNPYDSDKTTNKVNLEKEIGDILAILSLMDSSNDIDLLQSYKYADIKSAKLKSGEAFLHHN